ncbi:MAG TPA: aspartate aminotransferase family protein, partial [Saprospiraceae bacterium]|nr:aspartate aminotransferase family protein [Saprospiraceae bacterium]
MKLFKVYPLFDIEPVKGKGCYVYDQSGTKYLDFYGGHAVISIGHSHPHYIKRMTAQLNKIGFYSNSVTNSLQIELAQKLGQLSNCEDYQLFLCNSGAEANEDALKLASFATGYNKVIAFKKAFHGRTSAAVNVTDNPKIQAPINKGFESVLLDLNDIKTLKTECDKGGICAIIIEGIQGIAGINIPDPKFLKELEQICKQKNIPLILDEVQSGYGRSGKFFAFQHADIQPDIITTAKGMGNGFPIGGVLIQNKYVAKYGMLGHTFGGNHLACAAGLAVLEVMESEYLIQNSETLGNYFKKQLEQIDGVKEVRGRGLMLGIEFDFPIAEMRKQLIYKEHIFTGSSAHPNVLRLLPPLSIKKKH